MVTVVSKTIYIIIACGRPDGYISQRNENLEQIKEDFEMLGPKPLREKYFPNAADTTWTKNQHVWLNGYGFQLEFSDGSNFIFEVESGGQLISKDLNNVNAIYGDLWEPKTIFPEIESFYDLIINY
jgi:hypothetical protein